MNVSQDLSILHLILNASAVVQVVMALLAAVSFMSWYYIFGKWFALKSARSQTEQFERDFWSGGDLNSLYQSAVNNRHGTGSMEQIITHFKHIKQVGGIDVLALGSDFDGFGGHSGVRTCEDYPKLISALTKAGFTDDEIDKLSHKNVLRVIKDVIG